MLNKYFINYRKWISSNRKKEKITSENFNEEFINKNVKINDGSKILLERSNTNYYRNNENILIKKNLSLSFT
jgi:uncharacterized Fe-S cluster-containing protein